MNESIKYSDIEREDCSWSLDAERNVRPPVPEQDLENHADSCREQHPMPFSGSTAFALAVIDQLCQNNGHHKAASEENLCGALVLDGLDSGGSISKSLAETIAIATQAAASLSQAARDLHSQVLGEEENEEELDQWLSQSQQIAARWEEELGACDAAIAAAQSHLTGLDCSFHAHLAHNSAKLLEADTLLQEHYVAVESEVDAIVIKHWESRAAALEAVVAASREHLEGLRQRALEVGEGAAEELAERTAQSDRDLAECYQTFLLQKSQVQARWVGMRGD